MRPLADPFIGSSFPEVIEEFLERGVTKCVAFNRRGTILAGALLEAQAWRISL